MTTPDFAARQIVRVVVLVVPPSGTPRSVAMTKPNNPWTLADI